MAAKKTPAMVTANEKLRVFRWRRQGLDGSLQGTDAGTVLEHTGWVRSVGGSTPYLSLKARAGLSREAADAAVARGEICELPSARGCTYVVPAADYAIALRAGQGHGDEVDLAKAKKYCGVTDAEVERLEAAVLSALGRGELDPAGIKEAVGGAVRSLGPEGKKRGLSSTLPLALGRLQSLGEIRRIPANGRLDQQRYRYALWTPSPLTGPQPTTVGPRLTDAEVAIELGRRFFRWTPGATVAQFAWWAALGVKASKAAVEELGLVPLAEGAPDLAFPEDAEALGETKVPSSPQLSLVGLLDNLFHLRRELGSLLDSTDSVLQVPGEKGLARVGHLMDLSHHGIVDRGRLIGLWDWDGVSGELVHATFAKAPRGLAKELEEMSRTVREELSDVRSFSLDSPESRTERLAFLRSPSWK